MKARAYRMWLSCLWAAGFVLAIIGLLYLHWRVEIAPDLSNAFFGLVIAEYVPYLGAVLGFQFGARGRRQRIDRNQLVPSFLALGMSGLWNLIVLGSVLQACLDYDKTQMAMRDIKEIIPKLSWAVAPAIGFFFGREQEIRKDR